MNSNLWNQSGHLDKFFKNMFFVSAPTDTPFDTSRFEYMLKPMSCPAHIDIFKNLVPSFRDLPYKLCEFGLVHRNEVHGSLSGLLRLRSFTQDDAHIFCTKSQAVEELCKCIKFVLEVYKDFGFTNISVAFSTKPDLNLGDSTQWKSAECLLLEAVKLLGIDFREEKGRGAFYGPKLDFYISDIYQREWQCGTIQVDAIIPQRMNATYMDAAGKQAYPLLLHRAVFGSLERFVAILVEHFDGRFPLWLSPLQVIVCTISHSYDDYAQRVANKMLERGIRVEVDLRNKTTAFKIREHSKQKIPYVALIGQQEARNHTVVVRRFGNTTSKSMSLEDLIEEVRNESKFPAFF